jgi:hypothetical protein
VEFSMLFLASTVYLPSKPLPTITEQDFDNQKVAFTTPTNVHAVVTQAAGTAAAAPPGFQVP